MEETKNETKKEETVAAKEEAAAPVEPAVEPAPIEETVSAEAAPKIPEPEQAKEEVREIVEKIKEDELSWKPRTQLGRDVLDGKYSSLEEILTRGIRIKEFQIVDKLMPDTTYEIIFIGSSPGKGGGSKSTITRKTARMHKSGRRFRISSMVVIGNSAGLVGMGAGTGREHRLAIEKAVERAKMNMVPVKLGCGSWECGCGTKHSIMAKTDGRCGSVRVSFMPAPKGTGLVVTDELKKLLRVAGIKDVWCKTRGNTSAHMNLIGAGFDALKNMNRVR